MDIFAINVEILQVHCSTCGKDFERVVLPETLYGVLDFYTEDGSEIAVVMAAGNPVCEEMSAYIDKICSNISVDRRRECFWHIVKFAADSINGKRIDPFYKIRCHFCQSFDIDSASYDPAKFKYYQYPVASFYRWMQNSLQERETIMSKIIQEYCW